MASDFLEYTMTINKIKRPTIYKDNDAIYVLLIRLLLLEPGTNQAFPEMGVGLISKYRYSFAEKLNTLIEDYKQQISTYIPGVQLVDILGDVKGKTLILKVNLDNETLYPIMMDMENVTLKQL